MIETERQPEMSLREQIFQAVLFEVLLVALSSIAVVLLTAYQAGETTLTMITIALVALAWNVVFNAGFDRWFTAPRIKRGAKVRLLHAVLFEGGLMLLTVPIIAWLMDIGWWEAVAMDIGMTLAVMGYTVVFHWCYDHARAG